jgi:hypothetical protein
MSFISWLTRAQKLESGLNAVKPHLDFLLFLTMPRCKGEKEHMAPNFQTLKKQVVVFKTGDTPLVLARESICDGPDRQRAAICLSLDLQQQRRMLKIWMLWLPIAV